MNALERRSVLALAGIYSLRMLGLFMILPVFALYAESLRGSTPALTGMALGGYGLTMALLQVPFGLMSDRLGRKPVIAAGLVLFVLGSVVAAQAESIVGVIIGRLLQGSGAIAAAVMALLADLTDESQRTKGMAIFGMGIGFSFMLALVIGPMMNRFIGVNGLFWLAAAFGLAGIGILYLFVPSPERRLVHSDVEAEPARLREILADRQLLRLDAGIFFLHLMMTATFMALPFALRNDVGLATREHVWFYLPILLASVAGMVPLIIVAEKHGRMKQVFTGCVIALIAAETLMAATHHTLPSLVAGMLIYFVAFNVLEATLPSLVSRMASATGKGTAMGVYSTSQFFGAFCGGALGGIAHGMLDATGVFMLGAIVGVFWLLLCRGMRFPVNIGRQMIPLGDRDRADAEVLLEKVRRLDGVVEAVPAWEENTLYLKVDKRRFRSEELAAIVDA